MGKVNVSKKIALVVIFSLSLIALGGCGQVVEESPIDQGEVLTYTDDLGREVEYTTDKIVADYYIGELIYANANIVGANLSMVSEVWPEEKVAQITDVGDSLEEIVNLAPTLIITLNQDLIEQYEQIAPTIYIEYGKDNPLDLMKKLGVILNKEDQMQQVEIKFNDRIEQIKKQIDNPNLTYTIVQEFQGTTLYGANWGRGGFILYDYLGLKGTVAAEETYIHKAESYTTMTAESLLDYVGDVVIIFTDTSQEGYEDNVITQNPLFEQTQAYKNNQVYYIDEQYMYDDPYSVQYLLDYYEQMLSNENL